MNYSQFLNMIPEATLMAILIIVFIADFASSRNSERKWFNPLVCILMLAQVIINIFRRSRFRHLAECMLQHRL